MDLLDELVNGFYQKLHVKCLTEVSMRLLVPPIPVLLTATSILMT